MSFPAYEFYQDSGVPGLGEIPSHWLKGRFGYLLDLLVDGTHHSPSSWPEGNYMYVTAKNIKEHGFDFSELDLELKKYYCELLLKRNSPPRSHAYFP